MPSRQLRPRPRRNPYFSSSLHPTMRHVLSPSTSTSNIMTTSSPTRIFLFVVFFFTALAFSYARPQISSTLTSFDSTNLTKSSFPKTPLLPDWMNPGSLIGSGANTRSAPGPSARGFSDQSSYVGLSSSPSGAVIAVADFNRDRFLDLLMLDSTTLKGLGVMLWDHDAYSFKHVPNPIKLDSFTPIKMGKITNVYVADFGNDGAVDILVADGSKGVLFFGNGDGSFNTSNYLIVPELPPVAAIVDANMDSVPEMFVIFKNMTRGFWQLQRPDLSQQNSTFPESSQSLTELQMQSKLVFKPWLKSNNKDSNGRICRTEGDMVAAIAFADIDGDCLPDLIVPTSCGLEVWSNPSSSNNENQNINAFWDLSASRSAGQMRLLDTQIYNYDHGDRVIAIGDFDSDGTNDIAVVNRNRHDMIIHRNIQTKRPVGELCNRDDHWELKKVVGMASNVNLRKAKIGGFLGAVEIPTMLHIGDYDQDGLIDILLIDEASTKPVILRNKGGWEEGGKKSNEDHFQKVPSKDADIGSGNSNSISATFFDTDESGRQDILIVRNGNDTRLMWNNLNEKWDALFFKGTMLSGLPYRMEPRPFAPVVGNTIKLSYVERGSLTRRNRVRRICSQCSQTGGFLQLSTCNCQYGLQGIANYIEELWAGAGVSTRGWPGLMPNSMAVIWGDSSGNAAYWWMEYFTQRRGGQMLRVTAILIVSLFILGMVILYLQQKEAKEDREIAERESTRLFNFVV